MSEKRYTIKMEIKVGPDKPEVNVSAQEDLPGHPRFYAYLGKMALIHTLKNLDYGDGDPLGNFKFSEEVTGVPAWKGALVRLTDKWGRIKSLMKKKAHVQDETFEDTLLDNAVYSLLVLALREEGKEEDRPLQPHPTAEEEKGGDIY